MACRCISLSYLNSRTQRGLSEKVAGGWLGAAELLVGRGVAAPEQKSRALAGRCHPSPRSLPTGRGECTTTKPHGKTQSGGIDEQGSSCPHSHALPCDGRVGTAQASW